MIKVSSDSALLVVRLLGGVLLAAVAFAAGWSAFAQGRTAGHALASAARTVPRAGVGRR